MEKSQLSMTISNLQLSENISSLNSLHSKVLTEKRDEFQKLLIRRRDQYETAIRKAAEKCKTPHEVETSESPAQSVGSSPIVFTDTQTDHRNAKTSASPTNSQKAYPTRPSTSLSNASGESRSSFRLDNLYARRQRELNDLQRDLQNRLLDLCNRFEQEEASERCVSTPGFGDSVWGKLPSPTGMSADSTYLVRSVGDALRHAISHLCVLKPHDPIEALAHLLQAYSADCIRKHKGEIETLKTRLEEEEEAMRLDRKQTMLLESQRISMEDERRKALFLKRNSEINMEVDSPIAASPIPTDSDDTFTEADQLPPLRSDVSSHDHMTECAMGANTLYTIAEQE